MLKNQNLKLPELVEKLMLHLEEKGYAACTRDRLKAYYRLLLKFAKKYDIQYYNLHSAPKFVVL